MNVHYLYSRGESGLKKFTRVFIYGPTYCLHLAAMALARLHKSAGSSEPWRSEKYQILKALGLTHLLFNNPSLIVSCLSCCCNLKYLWLALVKYHALPIMLLFH